MVQGESDKKANDLKAWQCMVRYVVACVTQRKAKQSKKWAVEKPKLDNARQLCGIFFIEPDDEDLKHTMKKKNARKELEIPMSAAKRYKTPINSGG